MAFASLLEHVGGMGRFQVASVLLLALPILMMASHNLLQNFTAATSEHRCRVHWEANATSLDPQDLLKVSVPQGERCRRFVTPQWWLLEANGSAPNTSWLETEPCRDGWTYDRSVFTSTIITEWDLVCSSRSLKQLAQSLYMTGILVGGIIFGGLSDRFGRRSLLTWCYLQMGAMGICSSFAPTFTVYCLFRFLTGTAFSGILLNSVSLSLEWMPTRTRALVGTFMGYWYTIGQFLLAGVAYAIPDWRWLQFTVSLPFLYNSPPITICIHPLIQPSTRLSTHRHLHPSHPICSQPSRHLSATSIHLTICPSICSSIPPPTHSSPILPRA
uniref:Major facilitator superfamily (MFS) profile domain-containing protein n=1 Tax=Buteo japonicus TaxID=224669 RepID=A0A8B9Z359_9AVES